MCVREVPLLVLLSAVMASGVAAQQPQSPPAPITTPGASTQGMAPRPAAPTGHRRR